MQFWAPFLNDILYVIIGFVDILFEIFKIIFDVYYFLLISEIIKYFCFKEHSRSLILFPKLLKFHIHCSLKCFKWLVNLLLIINIF